MTKAEVIRGEIISSFFLIFLIKKIDHLLHAYDGISHNNVG